MPRKRPIRNVFGDADEDDDPSISSTKPAIPPKRTRTGLQPSSIVQNIASIAGTNSSSSGGGGSGNATSAPSRMGGPASGAISGSVQAQIEVARARIQAQMSSLSSCTGAAVRPPPVPAPKSMPAAAPRPNAAATSLRPNPTAGSSARPAPAPSSFDEIQRKVAEAKARLQTMQKSSGVQQSLQQQAQRQPTPSSNNAASARTESSKPPPGIHPLLLGGDSSKVQEQLRSMGSKFASLQANAGPTPSISGGSRGAIVRAAAPQANPYLADSPAAGTEARAAADGQEARPKARSMHKGFTFHRPGRHIEAAEEARREAQMEDLKRRIQESARKAGMLDDLAGDEKAIQRQPPPDVEWWDIGLLPNKSYDDVPDDQDVVTMLSKGKARETDPDAAVAGPLLYGRGTPIDHYIQHPIPIAAPSDQIKVAPAGVMLTKKEQKKMRRQRRAAEQQDKRDRIKMGLLPPDPPKVKLSNLMRVLTSEAVADPTKVEARVRREIAARKEAHERANAERKLTPEQRKEKALRKVEQDEAKGVGCQVYKIKHLVAPWHKKKVRLNAQDYHLTGITIFNPAFALVIIEGASKGLKGFKRLMTVRMDWTDPGRTREAEDGDGDGTATPSVTAAGDVGTFSRGARFDELATQALDDVDLAENKCELIFEGPLRERNFAKGFRAVACPSDHAAKETLGPKLEGYWDLAKRWIAPEDEGV